jgi:hypothetical protein
MLVEICHGARPPRWVADFHEQRDHGGLSAPRQLIRCEHLLIGDNHAFVGKQPSPQPKFERAGLLFLQRVEEYVPRN